MAGAIIENMSTKKLCIVGGILLVFQVVAFLVGGLIEPQQPRSLKSPILCPPPPPRLPPQPPAGDRSQAPGDGARRGRPPEACTSRSQTGFRVPAVSRTVPSEKPPPPRCLSGFSSLPPLCTLASTSPQDLGHPGTNFSANSAAGGRGCEDRLPAFAALLKFAEWREPTEGLAPRGRLRESACRGLWANGAGAGAVVARAAQAWALLVLCVAFCLRTWSDGGQFKGSRVL